jgi:hypothetical protein
MAETYHLHDDSFNDERDVNAIVGDSPKEYWCCCLKKRMAGWARLLNSLELHILHDPTDLQGWHCWGFLKYAVAIRQSLKTGFYYSVSLQQLFIACWQWNQTRDRIEKYQVGRFPAAHIESVPPAQRCDIQRFQERNTRLWPNYLKDSRYGILRIWWKCWNVSRTRQIADRRSHKPVCWLTLASPLGCSD